MPVIIDKNYKNALLDYYQATDANQSIPSNSVLDMDDASYHNRQLSQVSCLKHKKGCLILPFAFNIFFEETYKKTLIHEIVTS